MAESILSLRALNRATLARQLLLARHGLTPVVAIERLAGMQAQVARPPFVGLWSRLDRFSRPDLIGAIDRREIVRATMMRATIHLVSRADFLAWRMPLQPMLTRGLRTLFGRDLESLDVAVLTEAARRCFEDEPCTFADLRTHLKARFPSLNERLMGYLTRVELPLVQTPAEGAAWAFPASACFTVADGWLGAKPVASTDLQPLARRYLAAFGPATARDFQAWSGIQGGREIFDALRPTLRMFRNEEGRELFDLPKASRPGEDEDAPVRFLPEYDNLLLAFADRRRIVAPEHRQHLITRNLIVPATILVDGVVSGIWRVERKGRNARLEITPFGRVKAGTQQSLLEEAARLLAFLEPDAVGRDVTVQRTSKSASVPVRSPSTR